MYHGTYLEMVTTHVRLLEYGTQAMPIEGRFSIPIPKGAMALGTSLMT